MRQVAAYQLHELSPQTVTPPKLADFAAMHKSPAAPPHRKMVSGHEKRRPLRTGVSVLRLTHESGSEPSGGELVEPHQQGVAHAAGAALGAAGAQVRGSAAIATQEGPHVGPAGGSNCSS